VPAPPVKIYSETRGRGDTDKRLAELEKRLEMIMAEIKQLRQEGHRPHLAPPPPPTPPAPPSPPATALPPSRSK
jgi:hypothetical protein